MRSMLRFVWVMQLATFSSAAVKAQTATKTGDLARAFCELRPGAAGTDERNRVVAKRPRGSTPASLVGLVVDRAGRPLPGARVTVSIVRKRRFVDDSVTGVAHADARGLFRFDTLTATASYIVQVSEPGYLQQWHALYTTPGVRDSLCVTLYAHLLSHLLTPLTTNQDSTKRVPWSSSAGAQAAQDRRERVMVIPTLACGPRHQWDAANYLEQKVWVGLDTVRVMRISLETFRRSGGDVDQCEGWVYRPDSLRAYSAGDASAIASLYHLRALLSVRALAGASGVVVDVGIHVGSQPPVSEHLTSSPLPTAEKAIDELLPRIRALLARAGVLPSR